MLKERFRVLSPLKKPLEFLSFLKERFCVLSGLVPKRNKLNFAAIVSPQFADLGLQGVEDVGWHQIADVAARESHFLDDAGTEE